MRCSLKLEKELKVSKINSWEYRLKGQATIEYSQYSVMNTTQDGEKDIVNLL